VPGNKERILAFLRWETVMDATRSFRHQNYEMLCSARVVDHGKFAPRLIVSKQIWPTRPREIAVRRGDYVTEDSAIEAARSQGIEWILNYG
jgi:hypothetical protein